MRDCGSKPFDLAADRENARVVALKQEMASAKISAESFYTDFSSRAPDLSLVSGYHLTCLVLVILIASNSIQRFTTISRL